MPKPFMGQLQGLTIGQRFRTAECVRNVDTDSLRLAGRLDRRLSVVSLGSHKATGRRHALVADRCVAERQLRLLLGLERLLRSDEISESIGAADPKEPFDAARWPARKPTTGTSHQVNFLLT